MSKPVFEKLFFLARPAAGKSEIIHYLENLSLQERMDRYHVGKMLTIDDFPMLWTWFEEDDLLEKMGQSRLYTDAQGYFKYPYLWNVLIQRIGLEYRKLTRDVDLTDTTIIVEFSRGKEHGGYTTAFHNMDPLLAEHAGIVYVDVSWEESLRKNRKRFNPDKPDSILEHGLPDEKLKRLYFETDWHELIQNSKDFVNVQNIKVPYVIFDNQEDLTSKINGEFVARLDNTMQQLWELYDPL